MNAGNDLTKALEKFLSERDNFYKARGYRVGGKPPRFHTPLPMLKAGSYAVSSFFVVSQFNIWECPTELWLVDAQECIRINYYDEAPELHSWQGPFCHPMKVLQLFELSGSVFANYLNNIRSPEVEEYTLLYVETTPPEIMSHCRKYSEHFLDWLFHEQSYEELNEKVERNYFYK